MIPRPTVQVWDATGAAALGVLSGFSDLTVSDVFGDVGSLKLTVPRSTPGAELLDVDTDWQLKVIMPGVTDPLWFISDDDQTTWISDDADTEPVQVTCRSLHAVAEEAVVIPSGGVGTTPAEWAFTSATPGKIIVDLVASAQARGLMQGVTLDGTALVDAGGVAWPSTVTATYKAGATLASVLKGLFDAGLLEFRWAGRTLELHRPAGGMDRALDVMLRPRRDVLSAPLSRSRRSVATAVIVEGASSATARRTQSLSSRREREMYVSESSAPSGSLAAVGDLYLAAHAAADEQYTHELTDGSDTAVPWVDYRPGDRVLTAAVGPQVARRRVQQVAVSFTGTGTSVSLELGSLLRTQEEIMQRKMDRLLPGDGAVT